MEKDELTDFFQQIIIMLDDEVESEYLTDGNRKAILSLLCTQMEKELEQFKKTKIE